MPLGEQKGEPAASRSRWDSHSHRFEEKILDALFLQGPRSHGIGACIFTWLHCPFPNLTVTRSNARTLTRIMACDFNDLIRSFPTLRS